MFRLYNYSIPIELYTLNGCALFTLRQLPHWKKSVIYTCRNSKSNVERISNYLFKALSSAFLPMLVYLLQSLPIGDRRHMSWTFHQVQIYPQQPLNIMQVWRVHKCLVASSKGGNCLELCVTGGIVNRNGRWRDIPPCSSLKCCAAYIQSLIYRWHHSWMFTYWVTTLTAFPYPSFPASASAPWL